MTDSMTIEARGVQVGDTVTFTGTVESVAVDSFDRVLLEFRYGESKRNDRLFVDGANPLAVTRPDPRAKLIKRVARTIHEAGGSEEPWDHLTDAARSLLLYVARAAIGVMDEADEDLDEGE